MQIIKLGKLCIISSLLQAVNELGVALIVWVIRTYYNLDFPFPSLWKIPTTNWLLNPKTNLYGIRVNDLRSTTPNSFLNSFFSKIIYVPVCYFWLKSLSLQMHLRPRQ